MTTWRQGGSTLRRVSGNFRSCASIVYVSIYNFAKIRLTGETACKKSILAAKSTPSTSQNPFPFNPLRKLGESWVGILRQKDQGGGLKTIFQGFKHTGLHAAN